MPALRYLCLSDLHLGAAYSCLVGTDARGQPDPTRCSDTLAAFGAAMRQLLQRLVPPGAERPTLVLLGDVLDMGLSPMGAVAQSFAQFAREALVDAGGEPLFAPRVLCVPGNHDHHLWRAAQDQQFQAALDTGRIPRDLLQHTALYDQPDAPLPPSPLLTRLLRSVPGLAGMRCDIAYPNLALLDTGGTRCRVLHHGHYVDPMYRMVSTLNAQLPGLARTPRPADSLTVAQLEAENGAWVDFLWSDLGSAGSTGHTAMRLYDIMRDGGASHSFSRKLATKLVAWIGKTFETSGRAAVVQGITLDQLVLGAVDATLGQVAQSQRASYAQTMSAADTADLAWYIGGPTRRQLRRSGILHPEKLDLGFVFGHTHKPFEDSLPVAGFERPVAVFNTGGWVMDQPTLTPTQGASMVLLDAELNMAALRLFNDPVNGRMAPVRAAGVGDFSDAANPMLAALGEALAQTAGAWQQFSGCAQQALEQRARQLLDDFFDTAEAA
ncbi:metallophosphoesterase [Pseudorhodoferax soli]|uniref:Calcineurin-like phosphoesterase family protein n=1 Tax=Pseudorhodoferax soli TaxID=545864 RepID=A0A368XTB4_9BURK|nr:metallophosphoesterase [Pseudorhodoferax soli]RCW69254.1 calcineurin-like phosphoesterase family protein [Pseudorhodoferax soli]